MKPIGSILRREIEKKKASDVSSVKISTLDEQIAALAAEIDDNSENTENFHDNDELDGESDIFIEKNDDGDVIRMTSSLMLQNNSRIKPLPTSMLPLPMISKYSKSSHRDSYDDGKTKKVKFSSSQNDHEAVSSSTIATRIADLKKNYEPVSQMNKVPFWCRVCRLQSADIEAFDQHKTSREHNEAIEIEKKASYCKICRKQFTSPEQLKEHLKGAAHASKVNYLKSAQRRRQMLY